jgi:hypothetical protein
MVRIALGIMDLKNFGNKCHLELKYQYIYTGHSVNQNAHIATLTAMFEPKLIWMNGGKHI